MRGCFPARKRSQKMRKHRVGLPVFRQKCWCLTVYCFLLFPCFGQQPGQIYIGTARGLFLSDDRGTSWQHVESLGDRQVFSIAAQISGPKMLLAVTSDSLYRNYSSENTWERIKLPGDAKIAAVLVDPLRSGRVYGFAQPGGQISRESYREPVFEDRRSGPLWMSNDRGDTWNTVDGIPRVYDLAIDPQAPGTLFVVTQSCVYKSTDDAVTWSKVPAFTPGSERVAIDRTQPGRTYVGGFHGIARSNVGGLTAELLGPLDSAFLTAIVGGPRLSVSPTPATRPL